MKWNDIEMTERERKCNIRFERERKVTERVGKQRQDTERVEWKRKVTERVDKKIQDTEREKEGKCTKLPLVSSFIYLKKNFLNLFC